MTFCRPCWHCYVFFTRFANLPTKKPVGGSRTPPVRNTSGCVFYSDKRINTITTLIEQLIFIIVDIFKLSLVVFKNKLESHILIIIVMYTYITRTLRTKTFNMCIVPWGFFPFKLNFEASMLNCVRNLLRLIKRVPRFKNGESSNPLKKSNQCRRNFAKINTT